MLCVALIFRIYTFGEKASYVFSLVSPIVVIWKRVQNVHHVVALNSEYEKMHLQSVISLFGEDTLKLFL